MIPQDIEPESTAGACAAGGPGDRQSGASTWGAPTMQTDAGGDAGGKMA